MSRLHLGIFLLVLGGYMSFALAAKTGSRCKKSCRRPDGNYQSCKRCDSYFTCVNKNKIKRCCPTGLVWDDVAKRCEFISTTCTSTNSYGDQRPVHGQWSVWRPWSKCSLSCGGGTTVRKRSCDDPRPANGGKECAGKRREMRRCAVNPCLDKDSVICGSGGTLDLHKGICLCALNTYSARFQMSTRADKVFPIANGRVYAIGTKSIFLGYTDSLGYFPITGLCPGTKIVVRKADMLPLETSVFDGNSCPEGDSRSDNGADQVIIPPVSGPKRQSGGDGVCLFTNGDPTDNIDVVIDIHPIDHNLVDNGIDAELFCSATCSPACAYDWMYTDYSDLTSGPSPCPGNSGAAQTLTTGDSGLYRCRVEACNTCEATEEYEMDCILDQSHLAHVNVFDNINELTTPSMGIWRRTFCNTWVFVRVCRRWPCAGAGTCWKYDNFEYIPSGCGGGSIFSVVGDCVCKMESCTTQFVIKFRPRIIDASGADVTGSDTKANLKIVYAGQIVTRETNGGLQLNHVIQPVGHIVMLVYIYPSPIDNVFHPKFVTIIFQEIDSLSEYVYAGHLQAVVGPGKKRKRSATSLSVFELDFLAAQILNITSLDVIQDAAYSEVTHCPESSEELDYVPGNYFYTHSGTAERLPMLIYGVFGVTYPGGYVSGQVQLTVNMKKLNVPKEKGKWKAGVYQLIEHTGEWREIRNVYVPPAKKVDLLVEFPVDTPQFLAIGVALPRTKLCITTVVVSPVTSNSFRATIASYKTTSNGTYYLSRNEGNSDGFGWVDLTHPCGYTHRLSIDHMGSPVHTGDHVLPSGFPYTDDVTSVTFESSHNINNADGPIFRYQDKLNPTRNYYFNFTANVNDIPYEDWLVDFGSNRNDTAPWYKSVNGTIPACFLRFDIQVNNTGGGITAHSHLPKEDVGFYMTGPTTRGSDTFACLQFRCPFDSTTTVIRVNLVDVAINHIISEWPVAHTTAPADMITTFNLSSPLCSVTTDNSCYFNQPGFYSQSDSSSGMIASFGAIEDCADGISGSVGTLLYVGLL